MATATYGRLVGAVNLLLSAFSAVVVVAIGSGIPDALARSGREQEDLAFSLVALPVAMVLAFALFALGIVLVRGLRLAARTQRWLRSLALVGAALSLAPVALGIAGGEWFSKDYVLYLVPTVAFLVSYALVRNEPSKKGGQ